MFASKDTLLTRPSGGYTIARSVRTRASATAYFNRTFGVAGNRQTWTWSAWVKRGTLSSGYPVLFMGGATQTDTGATSISFAPNDRIYVQGYNTNWIISNASYRDPSAWYHIVVAMDSTQATGTNRLKLYVNGSEVSYSTYNNLSQNTNYGINQAASHTLAYESVAFGNTYFDGYMTEVNFVDGQQLTPSSFGTTNTTTGVWQPAKYTGTYGTNGFYLNFSDNSNNTATTIGKDYSGNGNNWTPNNISVTAGSTYDSMTDVPTLTSATAANYAVLNPLDVTNTGTRTIDAGNLNINTSSGSGGARSTFQLPVTGKWYFEGQYVSGTWSGNKGFGIGTSTSDISGNVIPTGCVTYNVNGYKTTGGAYSTYGSSYTTTDTVGIAVDQDAGTVTFYKNNTSQGAITHGLSVSNLFPLFVDPSSQASVQALNFGQRGFIYTPPTGFVALNTYNLPASTITNGAAYMAATTYTGTGAVQSISNAVNGVAMQPDWVWFKRRSAVENHWLTNSVTGSTKGLFSNLTDAEATRTDQLTSFNTNGFSLGSDTAGYTNINGNSYIAWQWKAGGTAVSNTAGSITSQVSANTTAGFSVVTYTGTGTNQTVGHGLGVAPAFIIAKSRNNAVNWITYHQSLGKDAYMNLNTTNASASLSNYWGTSVNSSTFGFLSSAYDNANGNMVAYCFSAVAGYSAFGSYTGNGSADGVFVYCGFRPRYVMLKCTSTGGAGYDWYIWDTSRMPYNLINSSDLQADQSSAEGASGITVPMDIVSNGFKIRTSSAAINQSSQTFIYMAFAENAFKNSLAR